MSSSSIFLKPRNAIALTASVASSCFYVAHRDHDQRALSENEVMRARSALARITPPISSAAAAAAPSSFAARNSQDSLVVAQHLNNLSECGATVVKDTLSPRQVMEWNTKTTDAFDRGKDVVWQSGRAYYNITKRSVHYLGMTRVGCCCDEDGDTEDGSSSTEKATASSWFGFLWQRGRKSNNNDSTENSTQLPELSLQDVVHSYFKQHGIKRYGLTDIQFLNAYPNKSTNQIWHRDNTFKGLTAIVALKDVGKNGPTELILGSHQPSFSLWPTCLKVMQSHLSSYSKQDGTANSDNNSFPDGSIIGCIDAGDTILYDARLFHRGRGNYVSSGGEESDGIDRPVLVLRWDASRTPPPGAGMIVTTANEYFGSIMYAVLFALQKISTTAGGE